MYMFISGFVHVMSFMSTSYLHLPICTFSEKKGIRLAAFLLVLQIRLETFSYFFVQVFSQTGFALSVLVKSKKKKKKKKKKNYAKSKI